MLDQLCTGLPAAALVPQLFERARCASARLVVVGPAGSGKTTVVPPTLANLVSGRVLVTQPRRVAARAAAARLAQLTNTQLGELVGYSVRGESRCTAAARVEFVTAGLLVRRLLADPELAGVGAVVLDEVHERSLQTDLAVGLLGELGQLRSDLTLAVMSATLDADLWVSLLGRGTALCSVRVPSHPLEVHWAPPPAGVAALAARGVTKEFLEHVVRVTAESLPFVPDRKSALVFLPGVREVDSVVASLRSLGIPAQALTGSLSLREQQAVLHPDGRQRVIVATAIAETSLTVPDVRLVVDCGLARLPRFDVARDMPQLVTGSVSQAAATQRAGRAARVGPGLVVRCYAERQWPTLPSHTPPEMETADLMSFALAVAAWGDATASELPLPQRPPTAAFARARATLEQLGAVDSNGITPLGRAMVQLPVHPRVARALLGSVDQFGVRRAAEFAAAIESEARAPGGDLVRLLRELRRGAASASARWRADAARLERLLPATVGTERVSTERVSDDVGLAQVVALAYPDRLARARGEGYQLASGTGAVLPEHSGLHGQRWLAVSEVARAHTSDGSGAVIRAAVPISEDAAMTLAAPLRQQRRETSWCDGRVRALERDLLGAIVVRERVVMPDPQDAVAAVRAALVSRGLDFLPWSEPARSLRRRLGVLHRVLGAPWPDVRNAALLADADAWLADVFAQLAAAAPLAPQQVLNALQALLPWPQAAQLDALVPQRLAVPTGSMIRLEYPDPDSDDPCTLAVKLQECFGLVTTPTIVAGRVPVRLHLLSPAGRTLAITEDLASFWRGPYAQVRAQMRGRYPKHPWPEDPLTAAPQRGTKRSGR